MSDHDMDTLMNWCIRCGKPLDELVDLGSVFCDGLKGVVHQRYKIARDNAIKIFGPIVDDFFSIKPPP